MNPKIPEVVVFDLGKVLLDFDYDIAIRRFSERSDAGIDKVHKLINSSVQYDYESGKITTDEFFAYVKNGAGFQGDRSEFIDFFSDIFSPMEIMFKFFKRVKTAGIPTCVFSNTNEIAIQYISKQYSFYSCFDFYVLSFQEKGMKPDELIYRVVEKKTKKSGESILYIDDRLENIETGNRLGWQTVLQDDEVCSVAKAEKLLGI
ncbi:MAG: HAD-IA family hydrolase [Verrucomicrobiota bacterium]|nr:HAD-IA family hydrolase [Verrucomicrobiota bacterium]